VNELNIKLEKTPQRCHAQHVNRPSVERDR